MNDNTYVVAYYTAPGKPVISVETKCLGNPSMEYNTLWELARKELKYADGITRTGSYIENRDLPGEQPVSLRADGVVRNVFDGEKEGDLDSFRKVGRCLFDNEPHDVILLLNRSTNAVRLQLRPLLRKGGTSVDFAATIPAMLPSAELRKFIEDLLGPTGSDVKLYFALPS